jgi:hypothetical protein
MRKLTTFDAESLPSSPRQRRTLPTSSLPCPQLRMLSPRSKPSNLPPLTLPSRCRLSSTLLLANSSFRHLATLTPTFVPFLTRLSFQRSCLPHSLLCLLLWVPLCPWLPQFLNTSLLPFALTTTLLCKTATFAATKIKVTKTSFSRVCTLLVFFC